LLLKIWYIIDRSAEAPFCCCVGGWPLLVEPVDEAEKTPSESSEHLLCWPAAAPAPASSAPPVPLEDDVVGAPPDDDVVAEVAAPANHS
jgi:hypothetical protein